MCSMVFKTHCEGVGVTGGAVRNISVDEKFPLAKFGSAAPAKKTVLVKRLALKPDPTLGQRLERRDK